MVEKHFRELSGKFLQRPAFRQLSSSIILTACDRLGMRALSAQKPDGSNWDATTSLSFVPLSAFANAVGPTRLSAGIWRPFTGLHRLPMPQILPAKGLRRTILEWLRTVGHCSHNPPTEPADSCRA